MAVPRVFVSFDFDHDEELKDALVGQARMKNTSFEFADWSLKEPVRGNWKAEAGKRIGRSAMVWVICGEHTDTATGVSAEVQIARKQGKPVHYIEGRKNGNCKLPNAALPEDQILDWTWGNLAVILGMPTASPETDFMPLGEMAAWGIGLGAAYLTWRAFVDQEPVRNPLRRIL